MTITDTASTTDDGATLDELHAGSAAPVLRTELPGPIAAGIIERDTPVTSPSYTRLYPLVAKRARGLVVEDVDGNRFLDFNAGIAVVAAGHVHPEVTKAIHTQADDIVHYCSCDFYIPSFTDLSVKLAEIAPMSGPTKSYLCNSGTEAVEAALKLARHHTRRPNVIAFLGAFHGRTLGSLSLTASKYRQRSGFGITVPGSFHAPYWNPYDPDALTGADYIEQVIFSKLTDASDVAAIFVEAIQGEGGYVEPPAEWLAQLRDLCDRHGILLVVDEVQSGIGRTGSMWACQPADGSGFEPDIMCIGKGLASGLPLAGIVARSEVMDWEPGGHGSTFGGNPVACAAALATIDLVERELADNACTVGAHLKAALEDLAARQPKITQVRGRGLMLGIDLPDHDAAEALQEAAFRRGLLTLTCGERTLRLAPPLVVTREQADTAVAIIADALED